ncbi:MAG: pyridoxal-phosphate dependent enzyme [Planctomycetes bacterium]|nr:pyridoxal-phosphate dependent enzyme [Planctomycetota bacterium]
MTPITLDAVREAAKCIEPYAHRTPVMTCAALDERAGRRLFFKCENFQKIGAFKFRGACNAVMKLADDVAGRGVVTHSSGNHAQALALAAKLRGIEAHIVMPSTASPVKRAAVEGYGGKVYVCEPNETARQQRAEELVAETGGTLIPPFDHPHVIAGQGTATLELLDEVGTLDAIVAPIGGGGLMSGTCIAGRGMKPGVRLFGAEPTGADDAARSLAAGELIPQTNPNTICDGLLTSMGELTWPIIRDHVEAIFTVSDEQVIEAMRLVMQRMKIVIEPSAAVAVAAVLSDEFKSLPLDASSTSVGVGVIISGGNVDLDHLPW